MGNYKANKGSFKKGVSGNPAGGPKLPEDLRLIIRTTGEQMKRVMCEVITMTVGEIQDMDGRPPRDCNIFRAALVSSLNNTLQTGDDRSLRLIMDRILGKIPEAPAMEDSDGLPNLSKDQTIAKLVEMMNDKPKTA